MRVVFMGTPEFARPSLEKLIASRHTVAAVVTQPDRPKGRGERVQPPPVKVVAEQNSIPVLQPEKVRATEAVAAIAAWAPEIIVVVAFGQILPKAILDLPSKGCMNVHASLLPKYRGAAPIQWAIINGERETGITTMRMDAGMDTGDMLLKESVAILQDDTAGTLGEKLSRVGAELLLKTLDLWEAGAITPEVQDASAATTAPRIQKEDGRIRWSDDAEAIARRVRGLTPDPGVFTFHGNDLWKIRQVEPLPGPTVGKPGEILRVAPEGIAVAAGRGTVIIRRLQIAGGKEMACAAFLRGHAVGVGAILGS